MGGINDDVERGRRVWSRVVVYIQTLLRLSSSFSFLAQSFLFPIFGSLKKSVADPSITLKSVYFGFGGDKTDDGFVL